MRRFGKDETKNNGMEHTSARKTVEWENTD